MRGAGYGIFRHTLGGRELPADTIEAAITHGSDDDSRSIQPPERQHQSLDYRTPQKVFEGREAEGIRTLCAA